MASISGSVTVAGDPDDWIACAFDADTHAFARSAEVSGGAYSITGLTTGKAYVVACRPKSGGVWQAEYPLYAVNDYVIASDTVATPYIFQATDANPGDPHFASTELLLPLDGTHGSTTFTDASQNGFTVTGNGGIAISTTQSKFDGASLACGSGKSLAVASNAVFAASGAFTVEFWVYVTAFTQPLNGIFGVGGYSNLLCRIRPTYVEFFVASSTPKEWTCTVSTGQWYHMAWARDGSNNLRFFLNGVQPAAAQTQSGSVAAGIITIGVSSHNSGEWLNGYVDDLRYTPGVCRFAADFTPPTSANQTTAGDPTGSTEPTWPTSVDGTVVDGGVTWTNRGQLVRPLMHGPLIAA